MKTEMSAMPSLRAEDDGFLMSLKIDVVERHLETLAIEECESIDSCVSKLIEDSKDSVDRGSSLPIYLPARDDEGAIRGYRVRPVWSGEHVDIPLYGDMCPEEVECLVKGKSRTAGRLSDEFLKFSPAFRVALLVHHISQIVIMPPLAAEAFVLGRYEELPFADEHYTEYGVPSTELYRAETNSGLHMEWVAKSPHELMGSCRSHARTNGWRVRFRGSEPKEALMVEAWREIRERLDAPLDASFTCNGEKMIYQAPAPSGRTRKRYKDPALDLMFRWVEANLEAGTFPMRGSFKDWKKAVLEFGGEYPMLADRWSSESMRKAYERLRRSA